MSIPSEEFLTESERLWKSRHTKFQAELEQKRERESHWYGHWRALTEHRPDDDPHRIAAWHDYDQARQEREAVEALRDEASDMLSLRRRQLERYKPKLEIPRIIPWSITKISPDGVFGPLGPELRVTTHYAASPRARNLAEGIRLTRQFDAFHRSKRWGGCCQRVSSQVMTPTGPVPIETLREGSVVIGGDGRPCLVTQAVHLGRKPLYRVTLADGRSLDVTGEHPWPVENLIGVRRKQIKSTEELLAAGIFRGGTSKHARQHRFRVQAPGVAAFGPRQLPIDPYVLGALIGDGSFTRRVASLYDYEPTRDVAEAVSAAGMALRDAGEGRYTVVGMMGPLREVGLAGHRGMDKFIPEAYLHATPEDRWSLLQGLLDTDGSVETSRRAVRFHTCSLRLRDDVIYLMRSFGWAPRSYEREGSFDGKPGLPQHTVAASVPAEFDAPFRMKRKIEALRSAGRTESLLRGWLIESIEPCGEDDVVSIAVGNKDHTYLADDFIHTHNSYHYLIPDTGEIILGRSTYHKGAHVLGHNSNNLGINFFCTAGHKPTKKQIEAVQWYMAHAHTDELPKRHRTDRDLRKADIRGHNQWPRNSTGCPGYFTPQRLGIK